MSLGFSYLHLAIRRRLASIIGGSGFKFSFLFFSANLLHQDTVPSFHFTFKFIIYFYSISNLVLFLTFEILIYDSYQCYKKFNFFKFDILEH